MPASQPRTRAGHFVTGLLSAVAVLAVVVGIPAALIQLGGDPLPRHVPDWAAVRDGLLHKDLTGTLFIRVLDVVGWLAWASFALAVLVEIVARLRRRRAVRLPGLAVPQRWAAGLVAAVALTFASPAMAATSVQAPQVAAVATVAPKLVTAAPAGRVSITVTPPAPGAVARPAGAVTSAEQHAGQLVYRVKHGDYLGVIAERYGFDFGTAAKIARANHIADPNLILPGWRIVLPAGAQDQGPRTHATGHVVTPTGGPSHGSKPPHPGRSGPGPTPGPTAPAPAPTAHPAPTSHPTAAPTARPTAAAPAGAAAHHPTSGGGDAVVEVLEASGTLAAVVTVAMLALRRREQRQQRVRLIPAPRSSDAVPPPPPPPPMPRLMAPTRAADIVRLDSALRHLGGQVQEWPATEIPQVAGVWLDQGAITLLLADEAAPAPAPFRDDPNGWLLPVEVPVGRPGDQLAPLPALCTVGGRAGQHVLLDLEYLRVLGIDGDPAEAMNLLRFIAVELCHNVWSDDVRVTLAGFGPEGPSLAAIDPARFRLRGSVAEAIEVFGNQLGSAVADLDEVRAPEVLLLAHPSVADQQALRELEGELMRAPGVGMSVVVAPTPPGQPVARYQMAVGPAGDLHVGFLGDAVMPAAALPSALVAQVATLIAAARAAGDNSPLDLARAASLATLTAAAVANRARLAGQHRRDTAGSRSFRRELDDLTRQRPVRPAGVAGSH